MLHLHAPTPSRWFNQVAGALEELLLDHAHCEKKAAGAAMNLLFAYVECEPVCRAMPEIVREELEHFEMVREILARRGFRFRRLRPSSYGAKLHALIRKQEPRRGIDRLLVAGLIEARSCERFGLLRDQLPDRELAEFFGGLFESEARHHGVYVKLAREFGPEEEVARRLEELARRESEIMLEGDDLPCMHS